MADEDDCLLCAKQRGEGPLVCPVIFTDDLAPTGDIGSLVERVAARLVG